MASADCTSIPSSNAVAPVRIIRVEPDDPAARHCLSRYYTELDQAFPGGFVVEQSHDPEAGQLIPPRGAFFVAFAAQAPVGCVALKGTCPDYAEIKRMWIDPAERGTGLARRLIAVAERTARSLGIAVLRLDTNRALPGAIAIYGHWGWREIPRFNDDPYAEVFFEKALTS
jgi:GNAT superfamily N-acetyltransferase